MQRHLSQSVPAATDGHSCCDVGGRPADCVVKDTRQPGVRSDHCDTELKLVLFGQHDGCLLGSFRRQMTVIEIIIADLH